jgi:hypothetical protein
LKQAAIFFRIPLRNLISKITHQTIQILFGWEKRNYDKESSLSINSKTDFVSGIGNSIHRPWNSGLPQ